MGLNISLFKLCHIVIDQIKIVVMVPVVLCVVLFLYTEVHEMIGISWGGVVLEMMKLVFVRFVNILYIFTSFYFLQGNTARKLHQTN